MSNQIAHAPPSIDRFEPRLPLPPSSRLCFSKNNISHSFFFRRTLHNTDRDAAVNLEESKKDDCLVRRMNSFINVLF